MQSNTRTSIQSGKVVAIRGDVVEVEFLEGKPFVHELLFFKDEGDTRLEVYKVDLDNTATCICFEGSENLYRGAEIIRTGETVKIPVGEEILGRLIDVYGKPIDSLGPLKFSDSTSVYKDPPSYHDVSSSREIQETGIKVIDFFTPFRRGGKVGLF